MFNNPYNWNIIPLYYFRRNEDGSKAVKLIDWQKYKSEPFPDHLWTAEYKAKAIVTGEISNLTILDVDSQEAMDNLLSLTGKEIGDLANFVIKTQRGYQLFYTFEPNTKTRIGIQDKIDFLNGGLTFAHPENDSYTLVKNEEPQALPDFLRDILMDKGEGDTTITEADRYINSDIEFKNPLQPLIAQFVDSQRVSEPLKKKLLKVFATKDFHDYSFIDFSKEGQKHTSMMYVGGIVAKAPTVNKKLYLNFMEQWAIRVAKIDLSSEGEKKKLQNRINGNMKYWSYDPEWQEKVAKHSAPATVLKQQSIISFACKTTHKYIMYDQANDFFYPPYNQSFFKEEVVRTIRKKDPEFEGNSKDVDPSIFPSMIQSFDPTIEDMFYTNPSDGAEYYNLFKRRGALKQFLTAEKKDTIPKYFKYLLDNVIPVPEEQDLYLHNLAYHMTYLQVAQTMTIITGKGGTGKGTLLNDVNLMLYGEDYHATVTSSDITKQFRSVLKNKLSVFIDEGEERLGRYDSPRLLRTLKELVGNSKAMLEAKNQNTVKPDNHYARYTLASNSDVPFKFENGDDRRTNIFRTKDTNIATLHWFTTHEELIQNLRQELPDFLGYLRNIDVTAARARTIINNKERQNMMEASKDPVDHYVEAILNKDIDTLYDIDHDFAEWFERDVIPAATVTIKDLKVNLGDIGAKVIKTLKSLGIKEKRKGTKRALLLYPHNTDKPFQAEVDGL